MDVWRTLFLLGKPAEPCRFDIVSSRNGLRFYPGSPGCLAMRQSGVPVRAWPKSARICWKSAGIDCSPEDNLRHSRKAAPGDFYGGPVDGGRAEYCFNNGAAPGVAQPGGNLAGPFVWVFEPGSAVAAVWSSVDFDRFGSARSRSARGRIAPIGNAGCSARIVANVACRRGNPVECEACNLRGCAVAAGTRRGSLRK